VPKVVEKTVSDTYTLDVQAALNNMKPACYYFREALTLVSFGPTFTSPPPA